jgi:hypothetical protein
MKKAAILVLVVFALTVVLASFLLAEINNDYQVVKKAVKENPNYKPGKEAKWFKLLVTNNETKKDKVRITLPIKVIELFLEHSHHKHIKYSHDECDIDLREIFLELKKLGPQVIIEVFEDGETIKIWLE